jgi:hypothetical protein
MRVKLYIMNKQSNELTPSNAWMVVYVAYNEPEAYIVAGRLESEGIKAFVHQEPVGRAYGLSVGPLGEVKVLVHPDNYDQAVDIIDDDEFVAEDTDIVPDDDE